MAPCFYAFIFKIDLFFFFFPLAVLEFELGLVLVQVGTLPLELHSQPFFAFSYFLGWGLESDCHPPTSSVGGVTVVYYHIWFCLGWS
jgi:hypothetical protein